MPELRTIDADDDGVRLDRWFKRHYPAITHGLLEKLLRTGEIRVDARRAKAADHVRTGQAIRLPPQVVHAKAVQKPLAEKPMGTLADRILYMDKQIIVLDKPAGLATQGGSGLSRHVDGMLDSLKFEKPVRPKLVHRLDRDTSGVLIIARTAQTASGLGRALALRDTAKVYWALVRGVPIKKHGVIKTGLAKQGIGGKDERMAVSEEDKAKFAVTEYVVMGQAGREFSWLAVRPLTGRTHQIRVHLASLGHPIVGDFKYGGAEARGKGGIADKLHLHARSIDIGRPDGGRLQVTAPLPAHMVQSWSLLDFDPEARCDVFSAKIKKR